jgi:hypothetical protein
MTWIVRLMHSAFPALNVTVSLQLILRRRILVGARPALAFRTSQEWILVAGVDELGR